MINTILSALTVRDIRRKVAFTALILGLYRLGAHLYVPGVNVSAIKNNPSLSGSGIFSFLNLFSGGALSQLAIFALGIMPYITASIILQLLQVVVPSLEKLRQEGEVGQARLTQYTRYLTVGLAFAQSIGYVFLFHSISGASTSGAIIPTFDLQHVFLIVISLTAGTVLVMWMGELITQHGIGNGISLMIFANIVSRLPGAAQTWYNSNNQVFKVVLPFLVLAVVAAVVFVQEGQRRIPVQYAKRVVGRRMTSGGQTYLPLRVNMAGVIPVIFAAALLAIPQTVASFAPATQSWINLHFTPAQWPYLLTEFLLIIVFTYFYTAVQFNPVDQADNLRKYGGYIPGIRPGPPTAQYLDRVLTRLTLPGSLFLAVVAVLPSIFIKHFGFSQATSRALGGTSVLIVVGVALDTMRQMESQMMMRSYEGFLR